MRYANVQTEIWRNPGFRKLPVDLRLFFFYLLTSEHSNMVGYYYLPIAYIHHDTQVPFDQVPALIRDLCDREKIRYDFDLEVVLLENYLAWNPVNGANMIKGALTAAREVPKGTLLPRFVESASAHCPDYRTQWQGLLNGVSKPAEGGSKGVRRGFEGGSDHVAMGLVEPKQPPPNTGTVSGTETGTEADAKDAATSAATDKLQRLKPWLQQNCDKALSDMNLDSRWGRYLWEGFEVETIQLAIEDAALHGAAATPIYIFRILDRWLTAKAFTLDAARALLDAHEKQRDADTPARRPASQPATSQPYMEGLDLSHVKVGGN